MLVWVRADRGIVGGQVICFLDAFGCLGQGAFLFFSVSQFTQGFEDFGTGFFCGGIF